MKRKRISTPEITGLGLSKRIDVYSDKPPKLRFKPGQIVFYQKSIWKIIYCYRLKESPQIWRFCLEEVKVKDKITMFSYLQFGELTNRIVYDCFRDNRDAISYFMDIPAIGDRVALTTSQMINETKLISSGEIV